VSNFGEPFAKDSFWLATLVLLVLTLTPAQLLLRSPLNLWDKIQHGSAFDC